MSDHDMGRIIFGPILRGGGGPLTPGRGGPLIPCGGGGGGAETIQSTFRNQKLVRKLLKFLPDAQAARGRSKDRSTQVGAVVIDDDFNVRASGYNGMARGVNDNVEERHQRPQKYLWAAHSEENCVAQAARIGVSLKGCTILLTSLFPCATCSRLIIQAGIKRIVAPQVNHPGDGKVGREDWDAQFKVSKEMLAEAGVEVLYYEVPE